MKIRNWLIALTLLCLIPFAIAKNQSLNQERYESVVMSFEKGEYTLSKAETTRLRTIIQNAQMAGNITKVEIAAWSDEEHPQQASLSKQSRDLALMRIQSVQIALKKDLSTMTKISSFNMAENTTWLGRNFHRQEAELDAVFAKKETGALARQDFRIIRRDGAPSKAVVLFKVRQ